MHSNGDHRSNNGSSSRRPFKLLHEKLILDVHLEQKSIKGCAELTLQQTSRRLVDVKEIRLSSRNCIINDIFMKTKEGEPVPVRFELHNYLEQVVPDSSESSSAIDYSMDSFNDYCKAAQLGSDEGELFIGLGEAVHRRMIAEGITERAGSPDTVVIQIFYEIFEPKGVVHFVLPDAKAFPNRVPHMFTDNQLNNARCWLPCVDLLSEHCTYDMEITVDKGYVAVCSGELAEQIVDEATNKVTFYYSMDVPTAASSLCLAVAPFEIVAATAQRPPTSTGATASDVYITSFCLPGRSRELNHTVSFLPQVFNFFEEYLGFAYPYKSYKQTFVEEAYSTMSSYASISNFSTHLIMNENIIDQIYKTKRALSLGLAMQWFGNFISVKSWADAWIYHGLAGYLCDLLFRRMFGNNESRFRMLKDFEYVCQNDTADPSRQKSNPSASNINTVYPKSFIHPMEVLSSKVMQKKAVIVMHMIDKRVGSDAFRNVISNLVSPMMEDESLDRNLSTKKFLKLIRKITGHDLRAFADRWIYGRGCPNITCGIWFNPKKHIFEFALKQNRSAAGRIAGSLVVRVNEVDGAYDHTINFDDEVQSFDFPCHSKVRKGRRKKRVSGKPGEEEKEVEEEEPEAPKRNPIPLAWVRIDPEMEWLHTISYKLPEFMWIAQLEGDTDVVAQYEAIHGLASSIEKQSQKSLEALNKILLNGHIYYRVRLEAAQMMAKFPTAGIQMLLKFYKEQYFNAETNQVKPNDFSDLSSYFLKKGILEAICSVKNTEGTTQEDVLPLLFHLLKNNDNSQNYYSDNYWIATVIRCFSRVSSVSAADLKKLQKYAERFLQSEGLVPCYHNTITIACLETLCDLQSENKIATDLEKFKEYSRYGHYEKVRAVAVRSLVRLGLHKDNNLNYLFGMIENERSAWMKSKVVKILATLPIGVHESTYFGVFLRETPENTAFLQRLWNMLNSGDCAMDARFRITLRNYWQKLWGTSIPRILGNKERIRKVFPPKPKPVAVKRKIDELEDKPLPPLSTTPPGKEAHSTIVRVPAPAPQAPPATINPPPPPMPTAAAAATPLPRSAPSTINPPPPLTMEPVVVAATPVATPTPSTPLSAVKAEPAAAMTPITPSASASAVNAPLNLTPPSTPTYQAVGQGLKIIVKKNPEPLPVLTLKKDSELNRSSTKIRINRSGSNISLNLNFDNPSTPSTPSAVIMPSTPVTATFVQNPATPPAIAPTPMDVSGSAADDKAKPVVKKLRIRLTDDQKTEHSLLTRDLDVATTKGE